MKLKQTQKASLTDTPADSVEQTETGTWGLLKLGAWAKSTDEEENDGEADEEENDGAVAAGEEELTGGRSGDIFKERGGFHFPTVLLDVDNTLPVFKSVLEPSNGDGDDDDMPRAQAITTP